jgi:NAD(P)-dependent dehydrogenase (short-subunit alcohol dehydrogenase family)
VIVVTGASSGIGRATAVALAREGARLVLTSRSPESLAAVAAECREVGADVQVADADVLDEDALQAVMDGAVDRFGRVDGWVHSAAVVAYGRFEDVPAETFRRVVDVGVHGAAHSARVALRRFREQGHGTLVLVGSLLGEIATPYMSSYVTAKWAVRGLARVLSVENRDRPDIHVCVVSPAGVDTPIYRQAGNHLGRVGRPPVPVDSPEKVAGRVLQSLSDGKPRRSVGPLNLLVRAGFTATPWLFDLLVGPLMRVAGVSGEHVDAHDGNVFEPRPEGEALAGGWT